MAREQVNYVYPGNTPQLDNHTYCPDCGKLLIERFLYDASMKGIGPTGSCNNCNKKIAGIINNEIL